MRRVLFRLAAVLSAAGLAGAFVAATPSGAAANGVHPGDQTFTNGSQCTSNFVFTDGTNTYLGQAAHCSSTGSNTDVDGCKTGSLPLGTQVSIIGASHPGVMTYNSWLAMQHAGETNTDACSYNDLALLKLDPADAANVTTSIPHWGGPNGVNTTGTQAGDAVYSYGNSILRLGITLLSPKTGTSQGDQANGWAHVVNFTSPGVPGDSGSAVLDAAGHALGVVSQISFTIGFPDAGVENYISDVNRELAYMHAHGGPNATLVNGSAPFAGNQLPFDTGHPVDDPVNGLLSFLGL